ncbi:MAG: signal recognition particle-docking protein FtsY [Nanoarchaeota archaeon]|nr:signal recognition particle-docking protein FtsY [Nanoarchaeota archaeon]
MFDFLKKKLTGWIGKEDVEKEKSKVGKKDKEKKKEAPKKESKRTAKDKKKEVTKKAVKAAKTEEIQKKEAEEIEKVVEQSVEKKEIGETRAEDKEEVGKAEEVQEEEKAGFFSKLFKKKEKEEEEAQPESVEEAEEEKEIEEVPKEEGFFKKLVSKISASELDQEQFDKIFTDLEITLLESNVALEAVDKIKENLAKKLVGQQIKKAEAEKKVLEALKESILDLLIEPPNLFEDIKNKEGIFTILFFGINGTGKTTSIAKIAYMLKEKGIQCVLAAGDTFRAASIEQLKTHGERIGVPVIASSYGSDPASVAFEARKYAEAHKIKVVLIDTAGRMYTKENLLKEMEKIVRVSKPDLKIFVGESITGNDAVEQARSFNESAGIDGIILSKADIDEKAGAVLSVSHVTGKPIYFLGTGQDYGDMEIFSKKIVLKNLGLE